MMELPFAKVRVPTYQEVLWFLLKSVVHSLFSAILDSDNHRHSRPLLRTVSE